MGDKYDRQLRLWGAEGQLRLAQTHVLLIGSSATGSEALKNLVLPGIQRFTILDDQVVTLADATNNFFVTAESVGRSRAETVATLLLEMNADVSGSARHANIQQVLREEPEYLDQFDLILATQLDEDTSQRVAGLCWTKRLPLILVLSYGFIASMRLQVAQHVISDAKRDPPRQDLRLCEPFPALQAFADSFDLSSLSSLEHAHVPYVVLLLQAMKMWKQEHAGQVPRTFSEKNEFKTKLQEMAWGPPGHEVNVVEAIENAYQAYVPSAIPPDVASVLAAAAAHTNSRETFEETNDMKEFWLLTSALAEFVRQNANALPVPGIVPDLTASTTWYIELQNIFATKATQDAHQVANLLRQKLQELDLPLDFISFEAVAAFCKKAPNLGLLETRSVAQEYDDEIDSSSFDLEDDEDKAQAPVLWYLMLRAVMSFVSEFRRYPGADEATETHDQKWLVTKAKTLARESEVTNWISIDHAVEMTRACQVELHAIAALIGGVAAQEAVKVITHQFEPLNHTYVFNGISGQAATYAF